MLAGPAAVLWDLDGTLVDTEPYWIEVEQTLVEAHGGTWTHEDALSLVGNDLLESGRYLREHGGVDLDPAEIVEILVAGVVERVKDCVPWRPGARELLAGLKAADIPCAMVTMSYRPLVDPVVAELPPGTFEVLVTGDAVTRGKPHPEPYLQAARLLNVDPSSCVAIEDSNTGTRSAEGAGCLVLVVPNHVPVLAGPRRVFRDSLTAVDLAGLRALWSDAHAE